VPGYPEVSLELVFVRWNLDVAQVRLLDEDDLVAVAADDIGRLLMTAVLKNSSSCANH